MTHRLPQVSIVIINFNYARYVGGAIESALAQTYGAKEIIVVDDGSTDGSREVIRAFGDRVRTVLQSNGGQTRAMNAGFAAASGEILMFLDADDMLAPDALENVAAVWRPRLAKVQFCLALISAEGQAKRFVFPLFGGGISPARIREQVRKTGLYVWPPTSGNAFARSFLCQVMPLDPDAFPCMTDGALNTVAPLYGEVVSIDKVLGYYRIHDCNMQNAPVAERIRRGVINKRREAEYLRQRAAELNIELPADLLNQMIHLEGRIASLKLDRAQHPVAGDRLADLILPALRKLLREDESGARRAFHLLWLLAVLVSPPRLCEQLVAYRFIPGARPETLNKLMNALRLVRRRSSSEKRLPARAMAPSRAPSVRPGSPA